MTSSSATPIACPACGSALAADQRYCLQCGARRGAPRVDPLRDMGVHEPPRAPGGEAAVAAATGLVSGRRRPRAGALAGVAAVVAGVVAGWLSGPAPVAAVSAAGPNRIVLLEPAAAVAPVATPTAAPTPAPAPAPSPAPVATEAATAAPTEVATVAATPAAVPDDDAGAPVAAVTPAPTPTPVPPPAIEHVWLAGVPDLHAGYPAELAASGTLLTGFEPVDASPLAEDVALLSGQPPTPQTRAGCPAPTEIASVDPATGIAAGDGCRYPAAALTLPGQLAQAGLAWKAYVADPAQGCPPVFAVFHSLDGACAPGALAAAATDPPLALAWLAVPDDATLRATLPGILASPAYADGGLVVLSAPQGALLLSPLVPAGATVAAPTGPYALLRTLEDAFGFTHLGHAADADVTALGADVFPTPTPTP